MLCLLHEIQGMVDIEDLIFDETINSKWNLLHWSIGMDEQLRFDLETMPKTYVHTVMALRFLFRVEWPGWILIDDIFFQ